MARSLEAVRSWKSEKKVQRDAVTGTVIWQMTDAPAVSHHFHFTNPSLTPNGRFLLFVSYRTGRPNLFAAEVESGEIAQLTDVEDLNPC